MAAVANQGKAAAAQAGLIVADFRHPPALSPGPAGRQAARQRERGGDCILKT